AVKESVPEHHHREDQVRESAQHEVQTECRAVVVRRKRFASGHESRSLRVRRRSRVLVAEVEHREGWVDREEERCTCEPEDQRQESPLRTAATEREVQAKDDQNGQHDPDDQQQIEINEAKKRILLKLLEVAEDSCRLWPENEDRRLDDDHGYLTQCGQSTQCQKEMSPGFRHRSFVLGS